MSEANAPTYPMFMFCDYEEGGATPSSSAIFSSHTDASEHIERLHEKGRVACRIEILPIRSARELRLEAYCVLFIAERLAMAGSAKPSCGSVVTLDALVDGKLDLMTEEDMIELIDCRFAVRFAPKSKRFFIDVALMPVLSEEDRAEYCAMVF